MVLALPVTICKHIKAGVDRRFHGWATTESVGGVFSYSGAIVYRLGHQVFILRSGVRLPVALPYIGGAAVMVWQETVNLPTSVTIGSIPIIFTTYIIL